VILSHQQGIRIKVKVWSSIRLHTIEFVLRSFAFKEFSWRNATKIVKDIEQGRRNILDQANTAVFSENLQVEPTTFGQAWNKSYP
jgi:hypothetical protein